MLGSRWLPSVPASWEAGDAKRLAIAEAGLALRGGSAENRTDAKLYERSANRL
jgi:hypothetical protein